MLLELLRTELPDVLIVRPTVRRDHRGEARFVWHAGAWADARLPAPCRLENHLRSHQWVLRGIHVQVSAPQGKLVRCLAGRVFDVAVDLRPDSGRFGSWLGLELTPGEQEAVWLPPGFGHGFLALTPDTMVSIQASADAAAGDERTLAWDDAQVGISWPIPEGEEPILSERDRRGGSLEEFRQ